MPTPETRSISANGRALEFTFRRTARARNVSVRVDHDGNITLVVPQRCPEHLALRFLERRAEWALTTSEKLRGRNHGLTLLAHNRADYLRHRERARRFVHECLARHAPAYGLAFARVRVKNLRSVWGSCSTDGNLNFNYKIIHLPERHAEYVVVHELCHLAEMNHSPRFWALVARAIPEHRAIRRALRSVVP